MGSKVKKLLGAAAPLVGLIPGIGPLGAAALGAGGGLLSGGGLRGALTGGLGAAALSGAGAPIGNALGASGATANALGTGLLGAGAGLAQGGLKGALLGGVTGGLGGYDAGGGFNGLGESLGLGTSAGSVLKNGIGPTEGTGLLGAGERALSGITGALSGTGSPSVGGGTSSYGSGLGSALSGISSIYANNNASNDILKAQDKSLNAIQPYLNASFNPGDLTQDPGYQFQLQQGTDALNRSLGAKGNLFSGAAIKAGQDYSHGLADSTYNAAYQRWLAQNQQNLSAANAAGQIYNNQGTVQANNSTNNANAINQSLAGLFGNGAYGSNGQNLGGMTLSDLLRGYNHTGA